MSEELQADGNAEQRAIFYTYVLGMLTAAMMGNDGAGDRSLLPPNEQMQQFAAGMQLDLPAIEVMIEHDGRIPRSQEIIMMLNSSGMRDVGQTYASATRQAVDTVDAGRNTTFLELPDSTRKEVYDELTTQMLAGKPLDADEYNLIGWALGNEKGSAKPSVSSNGDDYLEFVKQLNENNPEAAKATTKGSIDALNEIPMSTWATKAVVGGVVGPVVVSGAWVGALGLSSLLPVAYNAAGVAMATSQGPSATGRVIGSVSTFLGAAIKPLTSRGLDAYSASVVYLRSIATGQSVQQTLDTMYMQALNAQPSRAVAAMQKVANSTIGSWTSTAFKAVVGANVVGAVGVTAVEIERNLVNPEAGSQADQEAIAIGDAQRAEGAAPAEDKWEGVDEEINDSLVTAGFAPTQTESSVQPSGSQRLDTRPDRAYFNFDGGPSTPGIMAIENSGQTVRDAFGKPVSFEITADMDVASIEAFFKNVDETQDELDDPYLGVPAGHFATVSDKDRSYDTDRWAGSGGPGNIFKREKEEADRVNNSDATYAVPSQYRVSNVQTTIFNLTPAQLEYFQKTAQRAGLISEDDPTFLYGSVDQTTIDAMSIVMAHANNTGRTWRTQASILADNWQTKLEEEEDGKEAAIKPLFVPSTPYIAMDPETANQQIENDIERRLGRSANDWEMSEISRYMEANHRANYDEQLVGEKALWDARGRAQMGEDPGALPVLEEIDEGARYEAKFEERYETELDEVDRWERQKRDTANLFRSFDNISNQMGGV
jgi:hypothetical protein